MKVALFVLFALAAITGTAALLSVSMQALANDEQAMSAWADARGQLDAVVGDGGFQMTGSEISQAPAKGANPIVLALMCSKSACRFPIRWPTVR